MGREYGHGCSVVASFTVAFLPTYQITACQGLRRHRSTPLLIVHGLPPLPRWHLVALAAFCVAVPLIAPEKHTVEVGAAAAAAPLLLPCASTAPPCVRW